MAAINRELLSMEKSKVWHVIDLDPSYKLVGTTWLFKTKKNHLNQVIENKARLCAQGFTQTAGVDFDKTYSPTGRLNSLRTLIAFEASNDLSFNHIDVRSAFLNAPLSETVYLSLPQGLKGEKQKSCLFLNKAGYGLEKAPLEWYEREVEGFNTEISGEFEIKDIGVDNLMLGVKVSQGDGYITLDQQHYTKSLLQLYGMGDSQPVSTSLVPNSHLVPATPAEVSEFNSLGISYCSAIGSINYLSSATYPDWLFAVSCLSQFLDRTGIKHWQSFLHILRYLNGSQDLGLNYGSKGNCRISAYSDADWENCQSTRKLITGYLACFNQFLVVWKTRNQPTCKVCL
ncbi:hypothetical protein O181_039579 [Austropuccinia psidii MF-1]|uniref:Reverse transcriptase Ty1/copia-type domain-containing protein n=1 Tax=Austropuccinia psidii MF-1 TaxID=1389203 RepID=A0A9Q3DAK9_9BASI|nr:hypothetical protein [Austropuccinia psidii MF-1]